MRELRKSASTAARPEQQPVTSHTGVSRELSTPSQQSTTKAAAAGGKNPFSIAAAAASAAKQQQAGLPPPPAPKFNVGDVVLAKYQGDLYSFRPQDSTLISFVPNMQVASWDIGQG
jgi:hypothetical protein